MVETQMQAIEDARLIGKGVSGDVPDDPSLIVFTAPGWAYDEVLDYVYNTLEYDSESEMKDRVVAAIGSFRRI